MQKLKFKIFFILIKSEAIKVSNCLPPQPSKPKTFKMFSKLKKILSRPSKVPAVEPSTVVRCPECLITFTRPNPDSNHEYEICIKCEKTCADDCVEHLIQRCYDLNGDAHVAPKPVVPAVVVPLVPKAEDCPLPQDKNKILSKCVDCMLPEWIQNPYPGSPINKHGKGRMEYIHCVECIESLEKCSDSRVIEAYRVQCMMLNLEESNLYD